MEQTLKKYYAFEPAKSGNTVFGLERLADIEDEIRSLHKEHYDETEIGYMGVECSPSYDRYRASEEVGQFVVFTVRVGEELAGQLCYWVFEDMHANMKVAREDAFFIRKQFRGQKLAPQLLNYAETALLQLGCGAVGMTSKAPVGAPDIGPFLIKRGYKPIAMYYLKKLEKEDVL